MKRPTTIDFKWIWQVFINECIEKTFAIGQQNLLCPKVCMTWANDNGTIQIEIMHNVRLEVCVLVTSLLEFDDNT